MAITREDKMFFTKHLATMIRAGVPLSEALGTVGEQATPALSKLMKTIMQNVENGMSLGKAMSKYPKTFDSLYISLINAGEQSGTLDENLKYLADQQGKDYALRRKVSSALLYPTLVIGATFIMGTLISWFVLPKLLDMFSSLEVELPLSTKILMWFANVMKNYGFFVIFGMVAIFVGLAALHRVRQVKLMVDTALLKTPFIGKIIIYGQLGIFCRNLGTLLASGLPVVSALETTIDSLDNLKFKKDLGIVKNYVSDGKTLFASMSSKKFSEFSKLSIRMIEVGEKSGKLEEMLLYLSDYYEEEIETVSKNLSNLLEPVLLLFIGTVVGFVAMAIISPIYSLMGGIN